MTKPYFPGLHVLRAYAALSVVIVHVTVYETGWTGDHFHWQVLDRLALEGVDAVSLFLVLSGFLITILLLHERGATGTIDIPAFYRRRILRIWPLYYAMLGVCSLLALIVGGQAFTGLQTAAPALLTFTFNFALLGAAPAILLPLWSVAMEEQFYAVWPLLVRRVSVPRLALIVITAELALTALLYARGNPATRLLAGSRYDLLAYGALAAYGVRQQHRLIGLAQSALVRVMVVGSFTLLIVVGHGSMTFWPMFVYDRFVGILSALLIVNIVGGWGVVENRVTRRLGNISYGIYVLHPLIIYALIGIGLRHEALYIGALAGTIAIATVSYRFYESPFLRLKARFAARPAPVIAAAD